MNIMNNNNLMVTITIVVLLILIIMMIIHDRYIKKEKFDIDEDKAKEMGIDKALKVLKDIQENDTLNIKNLNVTDRTTLGGKMHVKDKAFFEKHVHVKEDVWMDDAKTRRGYGYYDKFKKRYL